MPFVKCLNCGKEFYVKPSWIKRGHGKFCSRKCMGEYWRKTGIKCGIRKERIKKICINCGKEFEVIPARADSAKFCSRKCKDEWQSKNYRGINNPHSNAGLIVITDELKEYIDGLLLGDGCIRFSYSKTSAHYIQSFSPKYMEWLLKVKADLELFGLKTGTTKKIKRISGKSYKTMYLYTYNYPEFLEFRQRWYPNGRKIVPRDLRLTPTVVLNWYLGDGNLKRDMRSNKIYYRIRLETHGFGINDTRFLALKLKKTIKIRPIVLRCGEININYQDDVKKFLSYIGEPPVKCFEYKWL